MVRGGGQYLEEILTDSVKLRLTVNLTSQVHRHHGE